jgi:hypothetical protein
MNRLTVILTFLTLTFVFGLTSCSTIFRGLYGMKKVKTVDEKTILSYSKKYNIPVTDSYELGTSYYSYLLSLDTTRYKEQIKNHYQPLQALYYDKKGDLQSFQVNCFTGGFPNLAWDRNEIMTTFPPKPQAPLDSIVPLETQLKYLKPLTQTVKLLPDNSDYIVIVFWNKFMGRQSKRLIKVIQDNSKLAAEKNIRIVYANTDNLFVRQENGSR